MDDILAGAAPADVAHSVGITEDAAVRTVDGLFDSLLRREPDVFELVDHARDFRAEGTDSVIEALASSDKYFARYSEPTSTTVPFSQEELTADLLLAWLNSTPVSGNSRTTTGFESVGIVGDEFSGRGGGTLITSQHVLTAAHLVADRDVSDLQRLAGQPTA
ncbi:MAG: hypothetical protein CMJ64_03675 [Planctomycetaceae bacterium]|nr:hypothetical protein [Planctomycetaceae bacterium]